MRLGRWPKFQKLHIFSFYTSGIENELNFALQAGVSEIQADFNIAIFGHETWPLAKVTELAHTPSFYPGGRK